MNLEVLKIQNSSAVEKATTTTKIIQYLTPILTFDGQSKWHDLRISSAFVDSHPQNCNTEVMLVLFWLVRNCRVRVQWCSINLNGLEQSVLNCCGIHHIELNCLQYKTDDKNQATFEFLPNNVTQNFITLVCSITGKKFHHFVSWNPRAYLFIYFIAWENCRTTFIGLMCVTL